MVGIKISKLRKEKGLSLSKLAEMAQISKSYLSDLENEKKENPSVEILEKIARVLEVPVSQLFDHEESSDNLDEMEEDMKILFSKVKNLSKENRKKVLKMMEIFTEENNN
ncbi:MULTISPECIES: helix-turn-helix domain-containing protein [Clostridium]|jgi:transcriptional regulator with XRE-family HTH domain|uniref:Transcriptional regulator n=1 Tax=Clostridium paraputrificum TaxID=29363 RepID=A0A1B8RSZ7_9CLOT|nr:MULTISPECIES: helix-turn-helix transcriptional regulator [Clostridium]MDB2091420.1 helix-turn-helix transcriptional regulator [Clostridium paraputrificum]MDU3410980.1 helix-turn-helix transcriptional regulator [Clostridium sp.]OBY11937.1 transcriptional regulator [Clostridium paraputrificum]RKI45549.1 XRE family transcriptional regulator [Clostridium paraputrificum]